MTSWINLDYNATTPVAPEVLEAMLPYFTELSFNPSSQGTFSKQITADIESAREQVAKLVGVSADSLIFMSGATEANLSAILSHAHFLHPSESLPVLVSPIEHSSVINNLVEHQQSFEYFKVDNQGVVDLVDLRDKLSAGNYAYLNLMWANNETGVIQPVKEIDALLSEFDLPWHCDISQAAGKVSLNLSDFSSIVSASISAHKFHGPKGVGALYLKKGCRFKPLIYGGGQESNHRSGTQNTPSIIGMGVAAQLAYAVIHGSGDSEMPVDALSPIATLRNLFESQLSVAVSGCHVISHQAPRLPNTSYVIFDDCEGEGLKILLNHYKVICAIGSACLTGKQQASHVPLALGLDEIQAKSALRFSLSRDTRKTEIEDAVILLAKAVKKFRSVQAQADSVGPVTVYKPTK